MRVLLTTTSFRPEYGGPVLSVSRLGAALAAAGADVGVWAPDGSAETADVIDRESGLTVLGGGIENLPSAFPGIDILHDNGVWLPHNHALTKLCVQYDISRVVSPRGMLEPWAIRYKWLKKKVAWALYQKRDLQRAAALHATSQQEADQLRQLGLKPEIHIAPNGVDIPSDADLAALTCAAKEADTRQTALFLGRVHPKKGLPLLVDAWSRLRPEGWKTVIAGPSEIGHAEEIAALVKTKGLSDDFEVIGPQYGEDKSRLLANADLFVLPTYSENFGIAVAEALAHNVPVLTTTGTPWQELQTNAAGWYVEPTAEAIYSGLKAALQTSTSERAAMGKRGRDLVQRSYRWDGIAKRVLTAYEQILADRAA
ncbi:MAG: glycosyltransferase [Henriciella sp.]|nr:glycosyltransferase [Henriciella sp.]